MKFSLFTVAATLATASAFTAVSWDSRRSAEFVSEKN